MKSLQLSTKIFLASGIVLLIFCLASFGILYNAQTRQAIQEMDMLLKNETLALSALASAKTNGSFDFEMSQVFLTQYNQQNSNAFFRFIDPRQKNVLKKSVGAPQLSCNGGDGNTNFNDSEHRLFRVKTLLFRPEIDGDEKGLQNFVAPFICLVVGIDQAPYRSLVMQTLITSVPILIGIVLFLIGILLILVRRLTRDLSALTMALTTANFGATHEFPILPPTNTPEVNAVVEKLIVLHTQAADVYREMWLFLGRAAHQLKTPVTAMQATLEVLLRKERSKEELLLGLKDVESAAVLLSVLTKKLISSSRISYQEAPANEIIELNKFFPELIKLFRSQADDFGISLCLKSESLLKVAANQSLLSDIFGNLIENAILYSPRGNGAAVLITWTKEGQNAVIEISDQGKGFPNLVKDALFEPFTRGDERETAGSGSGLGLSIAKKSAQLMGGEITLKASGANGSKLIVTLPLADDV